MPFSYDEEINEVLCGQSKNNAWYKISILTMPNVIIIIAIIVLQMHFYPDKQAMAFYTIK